MDMLLKAFWNLKERSTVFTCKVLCKHFKHMTENVCYKLGALILKDEETY